MVLLAVILHLTPLLCWYEYSVVVCMLYRFPFLHMYCASDVTFNTAFVIDLVANLIVHSNDERV